MHVPQHATVWVIANTKYRLEVELGGCARRLHEDGGRYWVPQCVSSPWMIVCWRGYVLCCECVVLGWRVVGGTNGDAKDATWQSACYIWSPSCVKVNCLTENTLRFHYGGQALLLFEGSNYFLLPPFSWNVWENSAVFSFKPCGKYTEFAI